eukprot:8935195-Pyramimonas_sp.AAC.1
MSGRRLLRSSLLLRSLSPSPYPLVRAAKSRGPGRRLRHVGVVTGSHGGRSLEVFGFWAPSPGPGTVKLGATR